MFNNEAAPAGAIYSKTLIAAKDAMDGETPTELELRQAGDYLLITISSDQGDRVLMAFQPWQRAAAIETAVELAKGEPLAFPFMRVVG